MASLGATAPTMLNAVKIAAEGAKVGNANLEDVTNALTAAIASGIPGVSELQARAMEKALNAIVGAGDMKMQDLAEAFGSGLLATVKGFGLSLKDVGAALDVFGDNNIRGAHAATDLRMAVQALAVPAATGKAQLQSMGLSMTSLADTMRQHGLLATLEELQARFKATGVTASEQGQVITEILGKKAGVGLALLMEQMDRLKSKYPDITDGAEQLRQGVGSHAADHETETRRAAGHVRVARDEHRDETPARPLGRRVGPAETRPDPVRARPGDPGYRRGDDRMGRDHEGHRHPVGPESVDDRDHGCRRGRDAAG